ncbi:serine/threonine-protein kinase F [Microcystis aeruginosa Sj]|uniref:non-specific serine/threonine protein kinase n=3 Tax=Microcystis aeruginosa TaxID=1126 RepID=A0A2Z6US33_MICAE|nr:serine/threonine-protein kinase [Microcystis aeruginosa]GBL12327.1 serine/threonine-protein kinase F [Microcystis aeruginosa Sj]
MKPCYCINPDCSQPEHPSNNNSNTLYCQSCGSQLLLNGKYRVSRLLSDKTGFGVVYEAFEGFTSKILKVLQEKWNNDPKAVELFKREYDVLLELSRQNVTGVPRADAYFQYSTREGKILHCLVMEKVEGIDLEKWLKQYDKLSQKRALKWLREITLILDKIHQQNWLHRDIKPPNIMLRNSGELVLIDFGTAREETQTYHQKVKGQQVTGITSAGYTPNEQQHGQAVIQSDFHALGRTFVHLLTGKHPLEIYDAYNDVLPWREETENIHPLLLDFIDELMGRLTRNRPANTRVILQRLDEIERQLKLPPITPNRPSVSSTIPVQLPVNPVTIPSQPVPPPTPPSPSNNWTKIASALGSVGVLALVGSVVHFQEQQKQASDQEIAELKAREEQRLEAEQSQRKEAERQRKEAEQQLAEEQSRRQEAEARLEAERQKSETFVPSESVNQDINEGEAISLIENLYYALSEKNFDQAMSLYSPQLAESFSPSFFSQFERVTVEDLQVTSRTDTSINFIGQNTYVYPDGSTQRELRSYTVRNLDGELKIIASEFIKVTKFR